MIPETPAVRYSVEKNIPIPPTRNPIERTSIYGLHLLNVTENVFIPAPPALCQTMRSRVMGSAGWLKTTGKQFASRIVPDGVRVWRIK